MQRILLAVAVLLFSSLAAQAQTAVRKQPGETAVFNWTFLATDESKISGFRLYSGGAQAGPFSTLAASTAVPSARTLNVGVTFPSGGVKVFYVIRSYFTSGTSTVESNNSNVVEVELSVPGATSLTVR